MDSVVYKILGSKYLLPLDGDVKKTKEIILMRSTILFAQRGYGSVSVKDIAQEIGIKASSLYGHFESKEKLWQAVLEQAERLYMLYFSMLEQELEKSESIMQTLDIIFFEPTRMENDFTCFAFSIIITSQFSDQICARIMNEVFLGYSIDFFKKYFRKSIEKGHVKEFDFDPIVVGIMYHSISGINLAVQKLMGRSCAYDHEKGMLEYKQFIIDYLQSKNLILK
ncbi:MAG: TetR/AcrR family transcriptional regulator [Clostridiales bacterium]|nr:TetR/AcrR family transcriptional regulator [Clostridiales bacterium]